MMMYVDELLHVQCKIKEVYNNTQFFLKINLLKSIQLNPKAGSGPV